MDAQHLLNMANNIAAFFHSEPDHAAAVASVAEHIRRFWDPRMRRALAAYLHGGGSGADVLVAEAMQQLEPAPQA